MNEHAIVVEGITRRFGDVMAVDGVDLAVPKGEVYGFLGPNGAGKTTLVRMLITLLMPTSGRAVVAGHDVVSNAGQVRLSIGAALQEAALDEKQSGRELLRLQGKLYGLRRSEINQRVKELEQLMDIGEALDRRIQTYSGGMKRRLDLAMALVHNPEVLFLDEPTTGLDPIGRAAVWDEVRRINRELGVTIFLTTQYLEEADALAERVGIINRGKLAAEGTPAELKRTIGSDVIVARIEGDPQVAHDAVCDMDVVEEVEIHEDELTICVTNGAADIGNVALALSRSGVRLVETTLRTPTLDDVFLQVTGGRLEVDAPTEEVPA